ncbi:MAG: hypothetical protein ACRD1Z_11690, partial [Vicinamibacteria bacterium]
MLEFHRAHATAANDRLVGDAGAGERGWHLGCGNSHFLREIRYRPLDNSMHVTSGRLARSD